MKLFLSQPTSFLTFTLPILSPHLVGEEQASGSAVLICWRLLNEDVGLGKQILVFLSQCTFFVDF